MKDKSLSEILENRPHEIYSSEPGFKMIMLTFISKSTEAIVSAFNSHEKSMKENSESNLKLATRVCWLNIILGIITTLGAIFGFLAFIKQ